MAAGAVRAGQRNRRGYLAGPTAKFPTVSLVPAEAVLLEPPAAVTGFGSDARSVTKESAETSSPAVGSSARSDAISHKLSTSALIPEMAIRFKGNDPHRFGIDPHADRPATWLAWDHEADPLAMGRTSWQDMFTPPSFPRIRHRCLTNLRVVPIK